MSRRRIYKSVAAGVVDAPCSKSYAHRNLLAAFLSSRSGEGCTVRDVELSNDVSATLDCIRALGGRFRYEDGAIVMEPSAPVDCQMPELCCRESGSTLRFFIPVALALCGKARFAGTSRLMSRGLGVYEKLFAERGISWNATETSLTVEGCLSAGEYVVEGNVSSQFITGLMFALPLLEGDSIIRIAPSLESRPYLEITLDVLRKVNVDVRMDGCNIYVKGGAEYDVKCLVCEKDWSNAAFLDSLNELGGKVEVRGLNEFSCQGDRIYREHFKSISEGTPTIDIGNCIDLGPVLFALAAVKQGATFLGTARLRIKESDRIADLCSELAKIGVRSRVEENSVTIYPLSPDAVHKLEGADVGFDSHNDHRIAMSLTLLATLFGATLDGSGAVDKSYPGFYDDLAKLGIMTNLE
ncbi:MAG: 3-phosphoshikimate 1-carboxyvinyltransferase [Bacteroidales bacterium]|nr:3-phosphoshikimate 1-carboxyvinyltransferase [Bacteroidales bacterium]